MRDADRQYPLQALLRVITEQVNVVEDDTAQLYENWFIETADDWAVPYIADLIGYRPVATAGALGDDATAEGHALNRVLIPRREVANTIRYRRRKGTLALLELLAKDVADWPARAIEFYKLLCWTQNVNHLRLHRARTVDLRCVGALDLLDGPFDSLAHTVDVRRINSHRTNGRYNIPSVGVFLWRLKSYPITHSPAYCAENAGPHCYTFSVLGQDLPLFINPSSETFPTHIAGEMNLPAPIRGVAFDKQPDQFYGPGKSFIIWAEGWGDFDSNQPIPLSALAPADLTDWTYQPLENKIAVDPVLGRLAFPPSQLPKKGVRVSYHYGFSVGLGGGEYNRPLLQQAGAAIYRVGPREKLQKLQAALDAWSSQAPKPSAAVIEVADSGVYTEQLNITLQQDESLQIRAAQGTRPALRLLDWKTDLPDALLVMMGPGSRFTLDGLLITGRALHVTGAADDHAADARTAVCGASVVIRHCTLVPGWGIDCDCNPLSPAEPSLELYNVRATVRIEHSILGSVQIHEDEVRNDPIPVSITDSILDATDLRKEALGAPGLAVAHAVLTFQRCTVFGIVNVHAIELAENSIFTDCLNVARRQIGCMRFSYVPCGCRTPRRYHCQPDLARQTTADRLRQLADQSKPTERPSDAELAAAIDAAQARETERLRPQFNSDRYGTPPYCQLADNCAEEIKRGADDESEMGVFHDLFQPQRAANLLARLDEFTPAEMDVGIIYAT
jgi:hypothetical protein